MNWLLRTVFGNPKKQKVATAGFVLPTVAMVSVVVVLLTTTIMLRSFDRAKNANNVRINEAILSAAIPAIDRSRAKINKLFQDISLPKVTPTDRELSKVIDDINNIDNINKYTFGDETKLQISFDISGNGAIENPTTNTSLYDQETVNTAWKFPVDTDNNGKFDSYTLYDILLRTPRNSSGKYARARTPLETRTSPMAKGIVDTNCATNTNPTLVGNTGWIKQNNELKKSFFVHTATVPITAIPSDSNNHEKYQGSKGFAAVEYQQDRIHTPSSNVVVYNDDLEINPDTALNLNGGVFTNSNFLTGGSGQVQLYQISSKKSCYYKSKNSKIIVGGNLGSGGFKGAGTTTTKVDLFKGKNTHPTASTWEASVTESSSNLMYNNLAYVNRINQLIATQFANAISSDPSEVKTGIEQRKQDLGLSSFTTAELDAIRHQQLQIYFQKRTRRVPNQEVNFGVTETFPSPVIQGSDETLR
ncbi:hormogonium polysaccharide biosynthesis protein HpsA, partial [Dolichospermum sp. ST_sed7]|nr:hormogonium polysaccharide biosynthesis protein HpsA [Dolichospermum sp. ST_sed7]